MNDDLDKPLQDLLAERGTVPQDAIDRALAGMDVLPERKPTRRPLPLAAAVVVLALVGLALVILLPSATDVATPSPSPSAPSQAPSPTTAVVTPSPTPTVQPRPVWAMNLADHLDCEGPPSTIGMDVPAVLEPSDSAPTPESVLPVIQMLYGLPDSGFSPVLVDGHWALYRYMVDGRPKVHAVSTDQVPALPSNTAWYVVGLRACDPSEYDPADLDASTVTIWSDSSGARVHTDNIYSHAGNPHCEDQRTVWLYLRRDALYIRDPFGDLADQTIVPFDPDVPLPADAVDTGYHTDRWHLFTIPSGRAVFIRTTDGTIERWPRAKEPVGCA